MKKVTLLLLILVISGCDKNRNNQYSVWYVNGKEFKTNDVGISTGKAISSLLTKNHSNGFGLTFESSYFPSIGIFPLSCTSNPATACFGIFYSDTTYENENEFLTASLLNDKASYELQESWFYNVYRPEEDSILVKGVFKEP